MNYNTGWRASLIQIRLVIGQMAIIVQAWPGQVIVVGPKITITQQQLNL